MRFNALFANPPLILVAVLELTVCSEYLSMFINT